MPSIYGGSKAWFLLKDLKQVILEMQGSGSEVHHNGENCPFCGKDWVDPGPDQSNWVCPDADCIDNKALAAIDRANEFING